MDSAVYECRRAESGRVIHVALELDAQKSGKKENWDERDVCMIINVIKIDVVRMAGKKNKRKDAEKYCEKWQGYREGKRSSLMTRRRMP